MQDHKDSRDRQHKWVNQEQEEGHPFSREIMDEQVLSHLMVPKVPPFPKDIDPENYLKAFRA